MGLGHWGCHRAPISTIVIKRVSLTLWLPVSPGHLFCMHICHCDDNHEVLTRGRTAGVAQSWTFSLHNFDLNKSLVFIKYHPQIFCYNNRKQINTTGAPEVLKSVCVCFVHVKRIPQSHSQKCSDSVSLEWVSRICIL